MKEEVIQQFWKSKLALGKALKTTQNQSIIIRNFGQLNLGQGPDFSGAEIEIDNVLHSGSVEIHVNSKEWFEHHHEIDEKYQSVVLHVVWENSVDVIDLSGRPLPVIELKQFFTEKDLQKSQQILALNGEFPCQLFHSSVLISDKYQQLVFAQSKRWDRKVMEVMLLHHEYRGDWQKVIMVQVAKYWMDNQNRNSMLVLVKDAFMPRLQRFNEHEMLAFWMGQSQINLDHLFQPEHKNQIVSKFLFLKKKFEMNPINFHWYFGRVRPNAFPDIRLWQWAKWVGNQNALFSHWLKYKEYSELIQDLSVGIEVHRPFKTEAEIMVNGLQHIHQLIINAIVPIWLAYATLHEDKLLMNHALGILEQLPPESNAITKKMHWMNILNTSAKHSQQLMGQYDHYCAQKKCLECLVGQSYLKST